MSDTKKASKAFDTFDLLGIRKTERAAGSAQAAQKLQIEQQRQKEKLKLAEEEDAVARRKPMGRQSGRASLLATSPTGQRNTALGGF